MMHQCSSLPFIAFASACWIAALNVTTAQGQESDRPPATPSAPAAQNEAPSPDPSEDESKAAPPVLLNNLEVKHDRAALEKELEETLNGAVLVGVWQMTAALDQQAPLSPPREERYEISRARKLAGDHWLIFARIHYADKDVTIPVPVRILWAGDTAVMTLDDVGLPMLGTYSARVTFHHGFYSGIWYSNAKNYGGVMMGRIEKKDGDPQADAEGARQESPKDSEDSDS